MSRQNVVSLFEVSNIYFGYFKLNCGGAGNADLLEIVGDVYALIDSGLFLNRMFDFPYNPARYSFDSEEILARRAV